MKRDFVMGMVVGAAVLGGGMLLGAAGQADEPSATVRTRKLEIVDDSGRVVLSASATDQGGQLVGYSGQGTPAVRLKSNVVDEGLVETLNDAGNRLVGLSSTTGGHGQISTHAPTGQPLLLLTANSQSQGQFYAYGLDGGRLLAFATLPTGQPSVRIFNVFGDPVVALQSDENGEGVISALDRQGKALRP